MPRQRRLGGVYMAPGNMTICPGCGSHCTTTEADRAKKLFDGQAVEDLQMQLSAAKLRIVALEAEVNVAKRMAERAKSRETD